MIFDYVSKYVLELFYVIKYKFKYRYFFIDYCLIDSRQMTCGSKYIFRAKYKICCQIQLSKQNLRNENFESRNIIHTKCSYSLA